jgi:hypothetical protein
VHTHPHRLRTYVADNIVVQPGASGNTSVVGATEITLGLYYIHELATDLRASIDTAMDAANLLRRHFVNGAVAQPRGRSLDGWRVDAMKPVAEAEEDRQPLIDRGDFFPRKFAEHATDPPLVNRSQVVDQREGPLREAALTRRQRRIQ